MSKPKKLPDGKPPFKAALKEVVYKFSPASEGQRIAKTYWDDGCRVLFLLGPAGTGKSLVATALALRDVLDERAEKIYVTRPLVTAGEDMGFLPGLLEEKVQPFMVPIQQNLKKVAFNVPEGLIEPMPLAFMRGITFQDCISILDEAQNTTMAQMKMYLSRLGKRGRLIITGDPEQSDIPVSRNHHRDTDFEYVVDCLEGLDGVEIVDFQDDEVVRDPMITRMLERLR